MAVDELFGYAAEGIIMALFDFLLIAVIVWGTVRIIARWLRTQEGLTQRQIKELKQRLHVLETQQLPDLHKSISVLEEIFVTEDVTLQTNGVLRCRKESVSNQSRSLLP